MKQNIYDNEIFFNGYFNLRQNDNNANNIFEKPALFSLLPTLNNKTVLDLGCGYGAESENSHKSIKYLKMPMEDIGELRDHFDVVVSSLAIQYVEDYQGLVNNIYNLLNDGGVLVFSQEHPINTCFSSGSRWTKDENGNKLYANVEYYSVDGVRESTWFVDGVKKYHRTLSTVINTLIGSGFRIDKIIEPVPTPELLREHPEYDDLLHKPDFLLVRATKAC